MFDVQIMAQTLVNGRGQFLPTGHSFFVLWGEEIMNAGGLSKRIVDLPMKLRSAISPAARATWALLRQ
ncbi:hypothetical protein KCP78_18325 [Salmonella enterica subsp. enterica]|nr:hypothetical protein KCP78_18325 [Salmonella enterica subsp. enterica]